MEIISIKGDEVLLVYHPSDETAEVGQQYKIVEIPDKTDGLIIQIISNDSLEYMGLQQEIIQRVLEERLAETLKHLDRETGIGQMRNLKVATAKIRKKVKNNNWEGWDGWIPTRNVEIGVVDSDELLGNILPNTSFPLEIYEYEEKSISLDGESLNMVNVITGVKGSGKSHTAKHFVLALANLNIPVIVFDINGEYIGLPNAQILKWGENFKPALDELGHYMLQTLIRDTRPLPENSDGAFAGQLPRVWENRRSYCKKNKQEFTIDISHLRQITWTGGNFVADAIDSRLETIQGLNLFHEYGEQSKSPSKIKDIYNLACSNKDGIAQPIIFDMRNLGASQQRALVTAMNNVVKEICATESNGAKRFPFMFYEEAHFYVTDDVIVDIITRGRHIGMGAFFVTNTPQELPKTVFRQLDNLFLLSLTHNDDIRNVSNSSFTDEETIKNFATRMPRYHSLIIGNITKRYPLVVKVKALPEDVPASGQTRSTWDRFKN